MKQQYLFFRNGASISRIPCNTIRFIQVHDHACEINTIYCTYSLKVSLKTLLANLPADLIIRVHRFFAVNLNLVTGVGKDFVDIHGFSIPVGRGFRRDFFQDSTTSE